jgi:hypothetical protein
MAKCQFCDKGVSFGIRVSHSHRRTTEHGNRTSGEYLLSSMVPRAMFTFVLGASAAVKVTRAV